MVGRVVNVGDRSRDVHTNRGRGVCTPTLQAETDFRVLHDEGLTLTAKCAEDQIDDRPYFWFLLTSFRMPKTFSSRNPNSFSFVFVGGGRFCYSFRLY